MQDIGAAAADIEDRFSCRRDGVANGLETDALGVGACPEQRAKAVAKLPGGVLVGGEIVRGPVHAYDPAAPLGPAGIVRSW